MHLAGNPLLPEILAAEGPLASFPEGVTGPDARACQWIVWADRLLVRWYHRVFARVSIILDSQNLLEEFQRAVRPRLHTEPGLAP